MAKSYEEAGVRLEAGYESVKRIKKHIAATNRPGMMGNIGSFGGMFDLASLNYKEPVLVSGTDGVGTKLKIAFMMDKHDTIGQDAVAMCVNDVLAQGAAPLFFLDYIAVGKNEPAKIEAIVKGVADGCVMSNCALIGGETAEMPDMYSEDEYDIAGFTVGAVEKSKLIDGSKVRTGDLLIGLASSGVHSNGFSLVRKIVFKDNQLDLNKQYEGLPDTLGNVLLTPTRIYVKPVLQVLEQVDIHAICHITGGGFDENIPRVLQPGQGIFVQEGSWEMPPIFPFLEKYGKVDHREMFNIFNMGVGMVLVVHPDDADKTISLFQSLGEKASVIGRVTDKEGVEIALL
ncbi:MAG: phosphoribosylformylglycinamidine cyclo-ligase [Bacteroidales bacterium]|jgi:phosphoribosylformylglycinamidine cyclo-ligase|nr:phosphoribosylformylglycinamidine cyclo-ligase [Bacteroidales bacterium]MCR5550935.1 phosphoribosylformylglycinamidine cyclo-ligase [Bacteroidales bacterium]